MFEFRVEHSTYTTYAYQVKFQSILNIQIFLGLAVPEVEEGGEVQADPPQVGAGQVVEGTPLIKVSQDIQLFRKISFVNPRRLVHFDMVTCYMKWTTIV